MNMINRDIIIESFQGMVGVLSYDENFPAIDSDLQNTSSGVYIDTLHPLFTHQHFYNSVNELESYKDLADSVKAYSVSTTYKKNDIARSGLNIYRSKISNNINNAVTDTTKWAETNLYSNYFRNRLNTAYFQSVQLMINRKIGSSAGGKNILNNLQLYKKKGASSDSIPKTGRFCGFRMSVLNNSVNLVIHKIALQLTQVQNNLKIYVYHADKRQPLKIFTLNQSVAFDMFEHELENLVLDWTMGTGDFIIGYYEDEITGQAIRNNIDFAKMSGGCCNIESVLDWEQYSKYVRIMPFYVNSSDLNLTTKELVWDIPQEMYVSENTFGINLWLSAVCEVTDFVIRQKYIFQDVVKQYLVVSLLKDLAYSARDTQVAAKVRGLIATEGGIAKMMQVEEQKLNAFVENLGFDANGINSPCLPDNNRLRKPRFGTIG
jgi:hypothetical protein